MSSNKSASSSGKTFEMGSMLKALDEKQEKREKRQRRAGAVSDSERKELAAFYEAELAKYATTKHGGGKAFTKDDEDAEDVEDTDLAGGSESESGTDEETPEDRDFIVSSSESEGGSDDDDEQDEDLGELTGGSDEDEEDD